MVLTFNVIFILPKTDFNQHKNLTKLQRWNTRMHTTFLTINNCVKTDCEMFKITKKILEAQWQGHKLCFKLIYELQERKSNYSFG